MTASRLSQNSILDAAAELLGSDPAGELSMRRLAEALDVWPMAVYRHFDDKDDLLGALLAREVSAATAGPFAGEPRARTLKLVVALSDVLRGFPPGLRARFLGPPQSAAARKVTEHGVAALRRAGFNEGEAESAWRSLLALAVGEASLEEERGALAFGVELILDGLRR